MYKEMEWCTAVASEYLENIGFFPQLMYKFKIQAKL